MAGFTPQHESLPLSAQSRTPSWFWRPSPDHHAEYDPEVRARLPLGAGATPERLVTLVESSTWGAARLERLWDVEWATRQALPSSLDRLIGVAPRFAVVAG
jgi:hypothetical protein